MTLALPFANPNRRRVELERKLQADALMSEERKNRQRAQHGKRESQYLRLRRTKIGLDDFRTVKVIGKGAFGEARYFFYHNQRKGSLVKQVFARFG